MKYLATADEMQRIDAYTIDKIGIPALVLMERAALSVIEELVKKFDVHADVLVVTESGNNGGDGLAVARLLISMGYHVDVYHIAAIRKESDSFAKQKEILNNLGVNLLSTFPDKQYDVVIDAIFGVGLSRVVEGIHRHIIEKMNNMKSYVLSIDVPSGLNATTGQIEGICIKADLTVTFGLYKCGMLLYPGHQFCGEIVIKDIGFPEEVIEQISPAIYTYDQVDIMKLPARTDDSNKGTYGKIAVIAGSSHMSGAACLAAEAAYRMGCGLVKVYTHDNNRTVLGCNLPEAILMTYSDEESAVQCVEDALAFGDVVLAGPGIGMDDTARRMISHLLKTSGKTVILDADALNILAENMEWLSACECPVVVTPHLKEMSRLVGETIEQIKQKPIDICKGFAKTFGVVCVLKDARTIVSDGTDQIYVNSSGNNGMSTAGSGDVLAGMIAGLCVQKMQEEKAATLGVYLHGLAGDDAASIKGQYCMLARDILEGITHILGGKQIE